MNNLKEINFKIRMCYYFYDIIKFGDFNLDNILKDEKSYGSISVDNFLYKKFTGAEPQRIRVDKIKAFIRVYGGTRYLVLFGGKKYDFIYRYLAMGFKPSTTQFVNKLIGQFG